MTTRTRVFAAGLAVRLLALALADWQDRTLRVKYTDIDYAVFTDAARFAWQGGSPYERATYRYSPLLALALMPNIWLHPLFGKVLFVGCDMLLGALLYLAAPSESAGLHAACAWLFNPIAINMSTRGSAESLVCVAVQAAICAVQSRRALGAGVLLGLAVHLKLYPIIYVPAFALHLGRGTHWLASFNASTVQVGRFVVGLCAALGCLTGLCWGWYGAPFIEEAYAYHLWRRDTRHNFSAYFYSEYLLSGGPPVALAALASFVPQAILTLAFAMRFASTELPLCLFVQTMSFVAFNKVCTAQYFIWFWACLPGVLVHSTLSAGQWIGLIALFYAAELHWLLHAYALEFEGRDVFVRVWLAGVLFMAVSVVFMVVVMRHRAVAVAGVACS